MLEKFLRRDETNNNWIIIHDCQTHQTSFKNGRSILLAYDDEEDFDFSFATEEGGEGSVMATAMATAISIAVAPPAADGIIEIPGGKSEKKC